LRINWPICRNVLATYALLPVEPLLSKLSENEYRGRSWGALRSRAGNSQERPHSVGTLATHLVLTCSPKISRSMAPSTGVLKTEKDWVGVGLIPAWPGKLIKMVSKWLVRRLVVT
jgi:hypothetical protein